MQHLRQFPTDRHSGQTLERQGDGFRQVGKPASATCRASDGGLCGGQRHTVSLEAVENRLMAEPGVEGTMPP